MSDNPDLDRRRFFGTAAAGIAASQLGLLAFSPRVKVMTDVMTELAPKRSAFDIRPFHYKANDSDLADLRRRIDATKWPEKETVSDTTQGVQLATITALARYWGSDYDWRSVESRLDAVPQFITEIDGLDIHFIHVRSKHENA